MVLALFCLKLAVPLYCLSLLGAALDKGVLGGFDSGQYGGICGDVEF